MNMIMRNGRAVDADFGVLGLLFKNGQNQVALLVEVPPRFDHKMEGTFRTEWAKAFAAAFRESAAVIGAWDLEKFFLHGRGVYTRF